MPTNNSIGGNDETSNVDTPSIELVADGGSPRVGVAIGAVVGVGLVFVLVIVVTVVIVMKRKTTRKPTERANTSDALTPAIGKPSIPTEGGERAFNSHRACTDGKMLVVT